MPLSSASTDAQVWQAYDDNASYEEDGSVAKARAFITACMILLRRRPQASNVDGTSVAFEAGRIGAEMDRARTYVAANNSGRGGGVKYLDFSDLRS